MTQTKRQKNKIMAEKRDAKVYQHLIQYAPVWLTDEEMIPAEDAIVFNVVFLHPRYGWVSRRYRFDSYNSVLYHSGQVLIDEEAVYDLQTKDPYIAASAISGVNSYGG